MQKCRRGNRRVFRHCWDTETLKRPCGQELLLSCRLRRPSISRRAARATTGVQLCVPGVRRAAWRRSRDCCVAMDTSDATSMLLSSRTFLEGPSLSCQCPNDQPAPADLSYRWRSRTNQPFITASVGAKDRGGFLPI